MDGSFAGNNKMKRNVDDGMQLRWNRVGVDAEQNEAVKMKLLACVG